MRAPLTATLLSARLLFAAAIALNFWSPLAAEAEETKPAELADKVDFARDIEPILQKRCLNCHGEKARGGLRLTSRALALEGGDRGPALEPGKSGVSLLVAVVTEKDPDELFMPPKGNKPLSVTEVRLLRAWIDQGAVWPAGTTSNDDGRDVERHWAFEPIVRPAVPSVSRGDWARNEIDRFVLARLEAQDIAPSRRAGRTALARRLTLDLTGLPPAPTEVDAFVRDRHPHAYERLVDQVLASPAYGERWGRHWLDVARYADSEGHEFDRRRPIWKYRDWVTGALNRDLPFDEFTVEQLAGDLLPNATRAQRVATGFNRNNMGAGPEGVVDRTNTVGRVFLGLTLGCAQCHSHKFDPISQREYYQLFAFFNNSDDPQLEFATPDQLAVRDKIREQISAAKKKLDVRGAQLAEKVDEWEENLSDKDKARLDPSVRAVLDVPRPDRQPSQVGKLLRAFQKTDATYVELEAAHAAIAKTEPKFDATLVLNERAQLRQTTIFIRGDFQSPGDRVEPEVPRVLPRLGSSDTSRLVSVKEKRRTRLDLAQWLVRRDHPLTARVTVNRIWQRYFGLGLVETEDDFGTQGKPPSHPKLLDWLASELVESGWSLKGLHRLIVTSATYRQSSHMRDDLASVDPRNRLLARAPRLRLEAEAVRDQALAVSGLLDRRIGGPAVFPFQSEGVMDGRADKSPWVVSEDSDAYRRGTYIHFWRLTPHPMLKVFDVPDAVESCTRRTRSNTALQALAALNHPWFVDCARALARRLVCEGGNNDEERVVAAFRLCLGREPTQSESNAINTLLKEELADASSAAARDRDLTAWTAVARVILNLDEFLTRE